MCTKVIKSTEFSVANKRICEKPDFQDGLCKFHFKRKNDKAINWIDRAAYRPATPADLKSGRSLKLSKTHTHKLFKLVKGVIMQCDVKSNYTIPTNHPVDHTIFCVLNF